MQRSWLYLVSTLVLGSAGTAAWLWFSHTAPAVEADPDNARQVAEGQSVYASHCTSCHGDKLQGEANWMQRKPNGRLPAPPHDRTGHTWHHPDRQLFDFVKNGITPYAPAGYQSDMPAFGKSLSDEQVWAVLAFIKSSWPDDIRERQRQISRLSANSPR